MTENTKPVATRAVSGEIINAISSKITNFIGGSADLAGSNKTAVKEEDDFKYPTYAVGMCGLVSESLADGLVP